MDLIFNPAAWASFFTLAALEIVLGVDNVVVLALLTSSLPKDDARRARSAGLGLALALRILLLSAISWIIHLTAPIVTLGGVSFSWRDLILLGGGLFLIVKAVQEIHAEIEGDGEYGQVSHGRAAFAAVIAQIALMDLIFSLDSIVTAVGLASDIEVMAAAICVAVAIMYFAANATGDFIERHPTVKMLALCFLILIGIALVADGFGFNIPRIYIYFAMGFAAIVEVLNIWAKGTGKHAQERASMNIAAGRPSGQRLESPAKSPGSKQAAERKRALPAPATRGKRSARKKTRTRRK